MPQVKRIVLDVLKPHHPNLLVFTTAVVEQCGDCQVRATVLEMDDKTETLELVVEGDDIPFDAVQSAIEEMGGSLHSIDEVKVVGTPTAPTE